MMKINSGPMRCYSLFGVDKDYKAMDEHLRHCGRGFSFYDVGTTDGLK
jgi:hypothetical protein